MAVVAGRDPLLITEQLKSSLRHAARCAPAKLLADVQVMPRTEK
jgi:hypothetical protein